MKRGWWQKSKIGKTDETKQQHIAEHLSEGCVQEKIVQETDNDKEVVGLCPYCAIPQNVVEGTSNLCPFCGMPFIP